MSLAELSAYARRHHLSVRLAIAPGGPAAGNHDRPTRLSELGVFDGPSKDAEEIEGLYLRPGQTLDLAAHQLLKLTKREIERRTTTAED